MVRDLRGAHALVTGGSRGLGPRIAEAFARAGARVTVAARSIEALERVASSLRAMGARAHALAADVTDEPAASRQIADAEDALGPVDVLVNNAGIEHIAAYSELAPEEISALVRTNLLAPLLLARAVLPGMIARRRGHLVAVSSLGGKKGSPYSATYAATKAGLIAWSSGLRAELRPHGVGVSVVCPGFVAEAGMFADLGARAPRLLGTSPPEAVADAVVRAVRRNLGEVLVNPTPVRPLLALDTLFPGIGDWMQDRLGVHGYYRAQASRGKNRGG